MPPRERAALLLTLMRQLEEVMRAEGALLRDMRLDRLRALQEEKATLAEAYETELRRLRAAPELLGALEGEQRAGLEEAMRRFQAAVQANGRQVAAARSVVEGIVRVLAQDMAGDHRRSFYGTGGGRAAAATARVLPLSLDRQL